MNLLMVSGDRQVSIGERGPFDSMQKEFSKHFERIDVLCPNPGKPQTVNQMHGNVHLHVAPCGRLGMARWISRRGAELIEEHGHGAITSHDYGWFYNGLGSAQLSARTGVPYLSEIHHVPGYPFAADWRERRDRVIARAYLRFARKRAAAFRVVNQKQMPDLLLGWGVPAAKILVLPSVYLDLNVFRPFEPAPKLVYDLCFVGRMANNKGMNPTCSRRWKFSRVGGRISPSCSWVAVRKKTVGKLRPGTRVFELPGSSGSIGPRIWLRSMPQVGW